MVSSKVNFRVYFAVFDLAALKISTKIGFKIVK